MLLLQKETHQLIGALMKVHREVGPGLPESIYQAACEAEFSQQSFGFQTMPRRWITHRERRIVELIPDFLVNDQIILDLKAILGDFPESSLAQILCYAKLFKSPIAILANFGLQSLIWKRLICNRKSSRLTIDSDLNMHALCSQDKAVFQSTVGAIRVVWRHHGPGYTESIYRELLKAEFTHQSLGYEQAPTATPSLSSLATTAVSIPVLIVEHRCPLYIIALHKRPTATHLARMRTYLTCLDIPHGYIVNFDPRDTQIISVTARRAPPTTK